MAKARIKIAAPSDSFPLTTDYINGIRRNLIDKGADPDSVLKVIRSHSYYGPTWHFAMDPLMTDAEKAAQKAKVLEKIMVEAEKAGLKVKVTA